VRWAWLPARWGGGLARPDRRTIALTGDGGLLYHIGELETAMRCNIPVVIVVLNNRCFGSEHHLLKHRWGGAQVPEVIDFYDVDYAAIARGFGVLEQTVGRAVGGDDATLVRHAELSQHVGCSFHRLPVRLGAHYYADHWIFR
jgi:acetolactate synthase-1/2/3 large subunit